MQVIKNKVQLVGHVGQAPEITLLDGDKKVARFTLVTTETYRNPKGEKVSETQWHSIVLWGKLADITEKYVEKGREIALEGKLINRSYTNKKGIVHNVSEIQASELLLLSTKS